MQLFQKARAELGKGASVSDIAQRAQELKSVAKPPTISLKPVEGPTRPSIVDHRLGEHSSNFDPTNPLHFEVLQMRNEDMAAEANRIRIEGKSDWKTSDLAPTSCMAEETELL